MNVDYCIKFEKKAFLFKKKFGSFGLFIYFCGGYNMIANELYR